MKPPSTRLAIMCAVAVVMASALLASATTDWRIGLILALLEVGCFGGGYFIGVLVGREELLEIEDTHLYWYKWLKSRKENDRQQALFPDVL